MLRFFDRFNVHTLVLACLAIPMSLAFLGCDAGDGPLEKAGENLDEAGEEIKDEADDATN